MAKEEFFLGILKFILEAYFKCEIDNTDNESEAINLIKNSNKDFDFLIYDYDPFSYFVEDLAKVHNKKLEVLILTQIEHQQNLKAFEEKTGFKLLQKEEIPLGLIRLMCSKLSSADLMNDSPFCPISMNLLIRFDGIKKNLFIKVGNSMILIFSEEEKTDLSDILKYHRKGLDTLYLKRSTAEAVTNQVQRQIKVFLAANNFKFVLRNESDSPESQFEQRIIRINEEIYIDEELRKIIMETVDRLKSRILVEKRIDLFISHLMGMPNYFHFFSKKVELTSILAIMLAEHFKWNNQGTSDKIVYASVLSDITLAVRPKLLQIRDLNEFNACKDDLTSDEREAFLSHPQECAALTSKFFHTAPPDTHTLILQHHELPNGKGFPNRLGPDKISSISAIFIIASDLAHYVLTNDSPSLDEYLIENEERFNYIHFRKIFRALKELRAEKLSRLKRN